MKKNSTDKSSNPSDEPKFGKTLLDDLKKEDIKSTLSKDFKELKEFYISEEKKRRLEKMWRIKRWFFIFVWLIKGMFFKLTPARRILVVLSVIFILISDKIIFSEHIEISQNSDIIGFLILLFVLMLELKDKLLARYELQAGRYVQDELMPERSPKVPGWKVWLYTHSANEVGGDLLDFLKISSKRYGLALGDVSGKGLRAALLMAKLQSTLRALLPDFTSLSAFGRKLNQIFFRDSLRNVFASMIYLELNPDSDQVRYINAGHMPPLTIKKSLTEQLPKGEPALGIMKDMKYRERELKLINDEMLLVYSDGVTEARNEHGDFYGEERLKEFTKNLNGVSAEEAGIKLLEEIAEFSKNTSPSDDLSLIILKRHK
ncbi:MAG: serine/threonine-protein phosphatase [Ignavibacteria bacterium]|nr:serine/threonine-protein phosphatase [Ignavibacteria bacterium]